MDVHRRYLLDDSLLDFFSCAASSMSSSQIEDSGHETCDERSGGVDNRVVSPAEQTLLLTEIPSIASFEGPVRRKTVMKNGDRPTVCVHASPSV
jgi:hypothetical protein